MIDGRLKPVVEQAYSRCKHQNLDIVRLFVTQHRQPVDRACFGIASPVKNGHVTHPDLARVVEADQLARELNLHTVALSTKVRPGHHVLDLVQ